MKRILSHIGLGAVLLLLTPIIASGQTFPSIQQEIRLFNPASSASIGLTSPTALSSSYSLILPSSQGAAGSILTNDGNGALSWTTTLPVANGGTGATSLTGVLIGNGTSAVTATTLSSGLASAISDETGTGPLVFATAPTLTTLTVSSGGAVITGATTINTTGTAATTIGNTGSSVRIGSVTGTLKTTVGSNDRILLTSSSGEVDQASISSVVAAGVAGSAWSLTGNSGLNASTNFLGSIDSVDVVVRHENAERMRVTTSGIRVWQGLGTPRSSTYAASFQNIGAPIYLELLNSDATTNGGGMYMGMRGTGVVGDTATIWNWQGGPLAFYTSTVNRSGTIRLFIDNDGDVGIGRHIPTARLHVRGGDVLIDTVGNAGTTAGQLQLRNPQGTAQTNIQAGAQTADITYTLPTAAPTANGQVLTSTTAGAMSWVTPSSGWSLSGNAGTTNGGTLGSAPSVGGNIIGTTDARSLSIVTNNIIRLQIATDGVVSTASDAIINTITVGLGAGGVITNTALGRGALPANTTGNNNVAVGRDALLSNTEGYRNVAVGVTALYSNTTGYSNQAIGFEALRANQSGYMNTAMGTHALTANTTGYSNVSIGPWSMYTNTTGQQHTAIGSNALYSNTTSLRNTAVGSSAMFSNTTGSVNTAIGGNALYSNLIGGENVAVGSRALYSVNTSGNTAVGADALQFSTTAEKNTAVGFNAQKANTTGGNNVSIGAQSLIDNKTGTSNVAIGYQAGYSETGSNKLYIANSSANNLIYGDFSTGVVSINAGTTPSAPGASLQVNAFNASTKGLMVKGAASQASNLFELQNSAGNVLMMANSDGTLTFNPRGTAAGNTNELRFAELAANGTNYAGLKAPDNIASNVIWTLPNADGTNGQVLSTNGSGTLSWANALTATSGWSTTGNTGLNASTNFLGTIDSVDITFRHHNIERLRLAKHGIRVSQGTGTPRSSVWAASFQNIGGPVYLELLNSDSTTNGGGMYMGMRGTGSIGDTATIWNWQGGPLAFYTHPNNRAGAVRLFIDSDGDVGIGSHIPTQRLHVRGGNLLIDTVGTAGTTSGQLQLRNPQGTAQTNIQAGFQTVDITYTLPNSAPTANGQVLTSNTAGVMSWANGLTSTTGWSTTGNSGTSSATNFIGTLDGEDLVLKRNNEERARVTNAGLRIIQNGTPRTSTWALSVQNIAPSGPSNTYIELINSSAAVDGGGGYIGLHGTGSIGDTMSIWNWQAGPIKMKTSATNKVAFTRVTILPSGNVGLGVDNQTPQTMLDIDGALTIRPGATIAVTADNQAVTIGDRSHVVLESNGTPANRTITISNGLQAGQILFIMVTGTAATNGIEIVDDPAGSNTNLTGLAQLVDGAVLQLIWNGADWMEVTRSNN